MNILELALDELRRFLVSRRGLLSMLAFALFWYVVLMWFVRPAGALAGNSGEPGLAVALDDMLGTRLLERWAAPELAAWWVVSLHVLPFVAVFAAADQIASDRARGTLRYLVLRVSRIEILAGRFAGQAMLMAAVVAVSALSVLALIALERPQALAAAAGDTPLAAVALWVTLLPWIALMALVSALASTPGQATRYALILWVLLSIVAAWLSSRFPDSPIVAQLLPGAGVRSMLTSSGESALLPAATGLVHAVVFLGLAAVVMQRRDL